MSGYLFLLREDGSPLDFGAPRVSVVEWAARFPDPRFLSGLLPSNSTEMDREMDGVDAQLAARLPIKLIPAARSAAETPLELLPYLALERSVDEFSGLWSEARRREVVAGSFAYHQVKGTRPALDRALEPLGFNVTVVEWFEASPPRPAYTFRLRVDLTEFRPWTIAESAQLVRVANGAKNAHTKLESVVVAQPALPTGVYVGAAVTSRRKIAIGQAPRVTTLRHDIYAYVGAALVIRRRVVVLPRAS